MKKVLIIGRQKVGEKNDAKLLAKSLRQYSKSQKVDAVYYEDLLLFCSDDKLNIKAFVDNTWLELRVFDLIILINWSHDKLFSDLAHIVAVYAQNNSIEVWNSELIGARPMTKIGQLALVAKNNIPIPSSLFSFSKAHLISNYRDYLSFPLIAKDPTASRGRRNNLVNSQKELTSLEKVHYPLLLQEYIENDSSDIRIIVGAGQPMFAFVRRGSGGNHLNNVSAGAKAEKIDIAEIPNELIEYTVKLARVFKKELCGIDFMFDIAKNRFVFLEINTTPQLINGIFATDKVKALTKVLDKD